MHPERSPGLFQAPMRGQGAVYPHRSTSRQIKIIVAEDYLRLSEFELDEARQAARLQADGKLPAAHVQPDPDPWVFQVEVLVRYESQRLPRLLPSGLPKLANKDKTAFVFLIETAREVQD